MNESHLAKAVVLHHANEHCEGFKFWHMKKQKPHDESATLAIANFAVVQRVGLHHIEQRLLARSILLSEKLLFRVCACDVATNDLLTRGRASAVSIVRLSGTARCRIT